MHSAIEWAPARSIADAAADDRQQLASQAATELRMRSLQVCTIPCLEQLPLHDFANRALV